MREPRDKTLAPGEIGIPAGAVAEAGSQEVLRAWIAGGGLHVSLLPAFETPDMWGMLLADVARHAARAFAAEKVCSEDEAMESILELLVAELDAPTDDGSTDPAKKQ